VASMAGSSSTNSVSRTARVWDAATGQQTGRQLQHLPDGEVSVWSVPDHRLLGAAPGAWRWLGYLTSAEGVPVVLPAETARSLRSLRPRCEGDRPVGGVSALDRSPIERSRQGTSRSCPADGSTSRRGQRFRPSRT
jgi:hypothetical protein